MWDSLRACSQLWFRSLTCIILGSGFALSLVFNIEQYQYMKGPQDEAGIKVLLHDSSEVPLVKDLGFAIAPGTHTLIAVQRQVVSDSFCVFMVVTFYSYILQYLDNLSLTDTYNEERFANIVLLVYLLLWYSIPQKGLVHLNFNLLICSLFVLTYLSGDLVLFIIIITLEYL